ncbi:MAG TPA: class I SAM-dependent rRNA methyltransferase [Edaphocola sp.]|nr:class I SAM-dependent rRNA methyltransferase [Edaphocola sp.]
MSKKVAVKLNVKAEVILKKGHPWIFNNSIVKIQEDAQTGDVAIVFSQKDNKLIGVGLVDMESPIRIKILSANKALNIDSDFFENRLKQALVLRNPYLNQGITSAFRWVYGESDGLPGMVIDIYENVAVLKIYSGIWLPYLEWIQKAISSLFQVSAIVLRTGRNLIKTYPDLEDGTLIFGQLEQANIIFQEYGVRFKANVMEGHKTGYFLDHRFNRHQVGTMSKGKTVLDVFAYAGGFSVHALAGGALSVSSVDISKQALALAQDNAALNNFKGKHEILLGDAFELLKYLQKEGRQFDIVVIDPPSFAKQRDQIFTAIKKYKLLAEMGVTLCKKGGVLVLASCSSRISTEDFFKAHQEAFKKLKIHPRVILKTHHDWDHPIGIPEMAYLKTIYYQL